MGVVRLETRAHAMDVQVESNLSTPYASGRISPGRLSFTDLSSFYSAPGSPTRGLTTSPFAWEATHGLTKGTTTDSDSDEFEFRSIGNFNPSKYQHQHKQQQKVDQLPVISFADGQVLPLKPPPRLQHHANSYSRSSSSGLYRSFSGRRSKKNEDSDPFMVALEKVREEETNRPPQLTTHCWRSNSLSSVRSPWGNASTGRLQDPHKKDSTSKPEPTMGCIELVPGGPVRTARSASERITGRMRMDPENQLNSNVAPLAGTETYIGRSSKNVARRWLSFLKVCKRRMIRVFFPISVSEGREYPKTS